MAIRYVAPMPLAWPEERVIHDDGSILAVCKPHGMIVHGGADTPAGDLLSCLQSRGQCRRLRVCSTLERGASGIVLLSYTDAARRELMERFEPEQWILTYHVAVSDPGLPSHGVLPPARNHTTRGAHGRFTVLERSEGRALLEVELGGPPPHSLRESLANLRAPVCGDVEHGGLRAYRLMLHGTELRLGRGRSLRSRMPGALRQAISAAAPSLGPAAAWRWKLQEACLKRFALAHNSSVYRLVNGEGDGLPGVAVERYADWVVLSISTEEAFGQRRALADALVELGARGVYVKRRIRADLRRSDPALLCPVNPECGEPAPAPLYVSEGQLKFAVELGGRVSTGLFPDQRESRQRILHSARGARVLNLFSYTGSFSVAAACGGAHSVTSVDASGRALRWARANFTLNGLLPEAFEFVRTDALRWLGRARPGSYDVIVLDPPSFSTSKSGSVFKAASDWSRLLEKTVLLLAPGGRLLTVTHHRSASFATLRRALSGACQRARRQAASFRDVPLPMDCPALGGEPTPTRAVWLNVK